MSVNYKVSSDIDTFLRKSTKEDAATFLGLEDTKAQWGQITGTLSTQTDLQSALDAKASASDVSTNTSNISTNTSNISANTSNIATNTSNIATNTSNIATNTSNIATNATNISTNATDIDTLEVAVSGNAADIDLKAPKASPTFTGTTTAPKIVTNEIQCEGSLPSGTDAVPINYDAKVHRFRDFDESPTTLFVIEKIDGYTGARIGINKEPSSSNAVALHVVAGKNASTNVEDLALKVIGGAHFDDFIRVGHYTDATRNASFPSPTNGTIIYNQQHHEFQGYVGGGTGWQKFNMGAIST